MINNILKLHVFYNQNSNKPNVYIELHNYFESVKNYKYVYVF